MSPPVPSCLACNGFSRRDFLKTTLSSVAAASAGGLTLSSAAHAAVGSKSETLVTTLFKSLNEQQRKAVCLPFDNALRTKVDNNWMIADEMRKVFAADQQAMIREIFLGLHSPEYADKVLQQVVHDAGGDGFEGSSVALFGEPGTGKFEFVLTGRHCTRRCDGDSVEGAAFGGPIFYGHAAQGFNEKPDHPGNIYWYQAKRANEVFQMLDGKQRAQALLGDARPERGNDTVKLTGSSSGLAGLGVGDLSRDQREHVRKVMTDVLAPFRAEDAAEAMNCIEAAGFDKLHLSFYKNHDTGNDGVWDVWQIEGPTMVWYFRGKPHVHVWVNVRSSV